MNTENDPPLMRWLPRGADLLRDPLLNKGTAHTEKEREVFGLRGLLPPRICTPEEQEMRVLENLRKKPSDLEKYIYLLGLEDRNETLFYRLVINHIEETMPLIYTPTVGLACQTYGHIFRRPRGLYVTAEDAGSIPRLLENWPYNEVRIIVVTDGERILGLGDLGADGMGIPVGKLSLYTACAGIPPTACLPVTLDVGTDNEELLDDPLYIGLKRKRLRGFAYDEVVEEFVRSCSQRYPHVLIQFEDFANRNAFRLLEQYGTEYCVINDDIQGTAAVALAGILAALKLTGSTLEAQKIVFAGAGEGGIGIGSLITAALCEGGLSEAEARLRCWYVDTHGLVTASRSDLAPHKQLFAHTHEPAGNLLDAVKALKPTVLVGVSGQSGLFTREVLETMASVNDRPVILALSNPTSKSECTATQAYEWTGGKAVYASGSPFPPVELNGKKYVPGQGNNAYVFPGVGLGVMACKAEVVTEKMFLRAAQALAAMVTDADLELGRIYPALSRIREISLAIAVAVAEEAYAAGLAGAPEPEDLREYIRSFMYEPVYHFYA